MASTYSQNLKIELMATGDQVDSWGDTTNENLGTTLEEAIVGYGAVQFTNDANLTLTLSNSNESQTARKFFFYVTSTVTLSAQRDLIVPTIEKTYTVHNNTTGGQAIRVKTSAGTGIVVPSGKKMILYVNGTNVVEQMDYVTSLTIGTLNIDSPLPVISGGTGASTASSARTNLGLGTISTQNSNAVTITGGSITGITDLAIADGGTGASTAADARTNLGLGSIATQNASSVAITGGSITGITDLAIADGGTGASTATDARTNLGLGSIATQSASSVSITGGSITGITDLAIADGGTGASTASDARTNLGLGSIATQNASSVSITGGSITGITDLAIADGGTGASTAADARTNLGAAASGANSDITSLSGLTTPLSIAQGGTGAATASAARTSLGLAIGTNVQAYDANLRPLVQSTVVASTSGTAIDFTGIPNWVKRITVVFSGVSASGTSRIVVRIGDSGGVVSVGYLSGVAGDGTAANETSGFAISSDQANTYVFYGSVTLTNIAGTTWISSGVIGRSDNANAYVSGGGRTLTGTLDRVRITTVNGTDTFDAGSINILYE